jgi:hypothetical protein
LSHPGRGDARAVLGSFLGMGVMAAVLFLVLASGLVAPWWAVALLTLVWVALFGLGIRWFMSRPWWVAVLPVVMLVVWFGTITLGAVLLGWTA